MKTFVQVSVYMLMASVAIAQTSTATKSTTKQPTRKASKRSTASEAATPAIAAPVQQSQAKLSTMAGTAKIENVSMSEFAFHARPDHGILTVTPTYTQTAMGTKFQGDTTTSNQTNKNSLVGLKYVRGISNGWSLSAAAGIGNQVTEQKQVKDQKSAGFTDITLTAQQMKDVKGGQFFWGADLGVSPGDKEEPYSYDLGNSKGERTGNLYSGGHRFGPMAGFQKVLGRTTSGVKASYNVLLPRAQNGKSEGTSYDITATGGNILALEGFSEMTKDNVRLGVQAGLNFVAPTDYSLKFAGQKRNFTSEAHQVLKLGAYGQIALRDNVQIIPQLRFSKLVSASGGTYSIENQDETALLVSGRIGL